MIHNYQPKILPVVLHPDPRLRKQSAAISPDDLSRPEMQQLLADMEITMTAKRARKPGSNTAVSCCGANPGMVSWLVKQALINVANDLGLKFDEPKTRAEWSALMQCAGVKGIHIAERDTQARRMPRPRTPGRS